MNTRWRQNDVTQHNDNRFFGFIFRIKCVNCGSCHVILIGSNCDYPSFRWCCSTYKPMQNAHTTMQWSLCVCVHIYSAHSMSKTNNKQVSKHRECNCMRTNISRKETNIAFESMCMRSRWMWKYLFSFYESGFTFAKKRLI